MNQHSPKDILFVVHSLSKIRTCFVSLQMNCIDFQTHTHKRKLFAKKSKRNHLFFPKRERHFLSWNEDSPTISTVCRRGLVMPGVIA
jgi:hypothetical protein